MAAPKTFPDLLYQSFTEIHGPFLSIAGVILVFVGYYFVPSDATVPMRWVIPISVFLLFAIFLFIRAAYTAHHHDRNQLPDVRFVSPPPKMYDPAVALMLLSPSPIFSYDTVVAVYQRSDEMEQLMGLGRVINIQENGMIQVLVIKDLGNADTWKELCSNDAKFLRHLLVKPNVPSYAIEVANNG